MKIKIYIAITLVLGLFHSCDYDLDKVEPNSISVKDYFQNADELTKTVNAVYAVLQAHQLYTREWFFIHDMRGDDIATGGGQLEVPRAQLLIGTNDPSNYVANEVWKGLYGLIHRANVVISKAPDVPMEDAELRARLVGEVKFLRSWAYFELVTLWGGVPIYTEYATTIEDNRSRSTEQQVYDVIIAGLKDAIAVLPTEYSGTDIGRATLGAAKALLARVYMYQADYASAKTELQDIIDLDIYDLTSKYNNNFMEETEYNIESVFEVGFIDNNDATGWGSQLGDGLNMETTLRNQEYNAISWRNAIPSDALLADFENTAKGDAMDDPRFNFCFYQVGDIYNNGADTLKEDDVRGNTSTLRGVKSKISWRKHSLMYKTNSGYHPSGLNERTIRYAEVLLMMAECQNETDEPEADVLATLNQIRRRQDVQMPDYPTANYPTSTKAERFAAIMHEKRIELCCECIRDIDLRRWYKNGKISLTELQGYLPYFIKNRHELLPIPQNELDRNDKITQSDQNPGY